MSKQGTVAVLGASSRRNKYGNKSLRAHQHAGWQVIPVNPKADEVEGIPAVARLSDIDEKVNRVTIYLPPPVTLEMLPGIAALQPDEVWFNPGAANSEVLAAARRLDLPAIEGCSIVDLGLSPSQFPS